MHKSYLLIIICLLIAANIFGQTQEELIVESSTANLLGITERLDELVDLNMSHSSKKDKYKKDKKTPNKFWNRPERILARPDLEHQGYDQVRQSDHNKSNAVDVDIYVNKNGLANSGVVPLDPTGSIGLDYYIQSINATQFGIYEKSGDLFRVFSGNTLWSKLNLTSLGDPIIVYDQLASRWILTEFTGPTSLLIAVSETSDPLGRYYAYEFIAPNFPDYPKYGIWNDHLVVSTNELGPGQVHQYFLDRHALIRGDEEVRIQRTTLNGAQIQAPILITVPVDWEGDIAPEDPRPMVLRLNDSSWGTNAQDGINIYQFDIDYDNPDNTDFELTFVPTSPYDGYPCQDDVPMATFDCFNQLGGESIAGVPETIMNTPQYRHFGTHESVVLTFITDVTPGENVSGIRWIEMRRNPGENQWVLYQEGTYAPDDGLNRFMPSIAIDRTGCISIAYSVSSADSYVGLRMTGRCKDDPFGEMSVPEVNLVDGLGTLNTGGRYGDYSQLSVDPQDGVTMWFTSEYASVGGQTSSRIVSYRIGRDDIDLKLNAFVSPVSSLTLGNNESIEVEVLNEGFDEVDQYTVSLLLDDNVVETLSIQNSLASRQSASHSFDFIGDFTELGPYNLKAIVSIDEDGYRPNDTLDFKLYHYADYDAALTINPINNPCGLSKTFELELTNNGGQTITEGIIELSINGNFLDSLTRNLNLGPEESIIIEYEILFETEGMNRIDAVFTNGSTIEEFTPNDNAASIEFETENFSRIMQLSLFTDKSPEETTWTVTDQETGEIVAMGGPYDEAEDLYSIEFCLSPEKCYDFTLFDSGGDGICCSNGTGIYKINYEEGDSYFTSFGMFGFEEKTSFCPSSTECKMRANVNVQYSQSESLGSIMVSATNGNEPYLYSIDNGMTYQESGLFEDLTEGDYYIKVQEDGECRYEELVTVSLSTKVEDLDLVNPKISVLPNPTDGVFWTKIENYNEGPKTIRFQLINTDGKMIQERKISKYNDIYSTQISLYNYPSGIYYMRFLDENIQELVKIIKQ